MFSNKSVESLKRNYNSLTKEQFFKELETIFLKYKNIQEKRSETLKQYNKQRQILAKKIVKDNSQYENCIEINVYGNRKVNVEKLIESL